MIYANTVKHTNIYRRTSLVDKKSAWLLKGKVWPNQLFRFLWECHQPLLWKILYIWILKKQHLRKVLFLHYILHAYRKPDGAYKGTSANSYYWQLILESPLKATGLLQTSSKERRCRVSVYTEGGFANKL